MHRTNTHTHTQTDTHRAIMRLQWFTANAAAGHVTQIMNLRTERNRMEWNVAWPWMGAHSALCLSSLTPAAAAAAAPTPIAMAAGNGKDD